MKFIVANWKMNGSLDLLEKSLAKWQAYPLPNKGVICLPAAFAGFASQSLHSANIYIGGQDCHTQLQGAFTGETSALHLKQLGCKYVIVGHSERRQYNFEADSMIKEKAVAAQSVDMQPIICIGENLKEYQQGKTLDVLKRQLRDCLPHSKMGLIIAYEPIWAIGSGKIPKIAEIENIHLFIRQTVAHPVTILYGGSVTVNNYKEILAIKEVDGVLVGGTSLIIDDFLQILQFSEGA